MSPGLHRVLLRLIPAVLAGVLLGLIEVALVAASRAELFLSLREFGRFGAIVLCVAVSIQLLIACASGALAQLLSRLSRERFTLALALTTGACAAPLSAWLYWTLTQGRRVRDLNYRPLLVSAAALLTSLVLMGCVLGLLRAARASDVVRRILWGSLLLLAAAALGADIWVLHRLYPSFHWALSVLAVLAIAGSVKLWPFPPPRQLATLQMAVGLGLVAAAAGPFLLRSTQHAPNLRYVIEEAAPLTGKLLRLLRPRSRALTRITAAPVRARETPTQPGVSLRGHDILVITIDALRADRLRAYGSHWDVTPQLDKLAANSAVFARAYTQTPHTSYAIGSLWTGKYLRPVLSLPAAARDHATLARVLRRFNYRTAAFYPPAVFFVDERRFSTLAADHFGFEYVKEMYAPALDRVEQLREYLDQVDPGHPVFVWVHLFEPHEPYEPKPQFARGDEPEQRYDAEVAAADEAAGQLIELFRQRKPESTVIVTSDHGEEFGDHGGHYHGTTLFEEQVHVPLLWSSPGRVPPHRVEAPVQLIDLAPSLLAALSIPHDPRMRGSDLGPLLRGAPSTGESRAFASIDELRMWTDGSYKLICEANEGTCRMYDLVNDPSESRDASAAHPEVARRLASELSALVASIPDGEVLAMQSGDAWPKALARARLGDRAAREELLPLLGDPRAAVRAETLRAIATLRVASGLGLVQTLADQDTDATVRDEAALTALSLGDAQYAPRVQQLLASAKSGAEGLEVARRAAFALATEASPQAAKILAELAADRSVSLHLREQALAALGQSRARAMAPALLALLDDVRLRPAVARCLGQLGGKGVERALLQALQNERYPGARAAEVEALVSLRSRRVLPRIIQFLGTETGLPGGLEHWSSLHASANGTPGVLVDLRAASAARALRGPWKCRTKLTAEGPPGCKPGRGGIVNLVGRLPNAELRAAFSVWSSGSDEWLRVGTQELALHRGRNEVALPLRLERGHTQLSLRASEGCYIELIGVVPRSPDVPPPAPEPYETVATTQP